MPRLFHVPHLSVVVNEKRKPLALQDLCMISYHVDRYAIIMLFNYAVLLIVLLAGAM